MELFDENQRRWFHSFLCAATTKDNTKKVVIVTGGIAICGMAGGRSGNARPIEDEIIRRNIKYFGVGMPCSLMGAS